MPSPARRSASFELRALETAADMVECVRLQQVCWRYADRDLVPVNELLAAVKAGGIAIGAFVGERRAAATEHARMIGFCFGLLGREHDTGRLYHASRMLAVDPAYRGRGVATALKQAQRRAARAQGLERMRWTFDPLRLENAWLNLHKLGALGIAYHRDLFGHATSSPLHRAGTDRLEVEWRLDAGPARAGYAVVERIALPGDVEALVQAGAHALTAARARLRERLEAALGRGDVVIDVERSPERTQAWYLIGRPPT